MRDIGILVYIWNSVLYSDSMSRKARIDASEALHHIFVRGIECRKIFLDDFYRDHFLQL